MPNRNTIAKAIIGALGIAYLDAKFLLSWDMHAISCVLAARRR